ncbi:hypothetical protein Syun_027848 [Stephania yunnanensis]|uniref:Uncharacterized protein n=1 Tax=Stephania yunnanensis TaxID=152371 RepID=A0AAP0HQB3_9MAGN
MAPSCWKLAKPSIVELPTVVGVNVPPRLAAAAATTCPQTPLRPSPESHDIKRVLEEISRARNDPSVEQPAKDYDRLYMEESELAFYGFLVKIRKNGQDSKTLVNVLNGWNLGTTGFCGATGSCGTLGASNYWARTTWCFFCLSSGRSTSWPAIGED